jgi:photosynthetic reaction center H subunit
MPSGFITSHINVAQLVLYAFWIFFAFLIIYLRREDKREGYPLESDRSDRAPRVKVVGFPRPPSPKTFLLPHDQGTRQKPEPSAAAAPIAWAKPQAAWPGAPLVPTGDPMRDGVGPASYANRDDVPDLAITGKPKIVPMRVAADFKVEATDPDPRGMSVVAADGKTVGQVVDLWVDRAEPRILYFEVALDRSDKAEGEDAAVNNPLLPYGFAKVKFGKQRIEVCSIMSEHFQHVPRTASSEQVTRLEEDKITAYFAGGHLYAEPSRQDPLI